MTESEAREAQKQLVEFGLCADLDEAAHMLVDAGEIDSDIHEAILSDKEAQRVYG